MDQIIIRPAIINDLQTLLRFEQGIVATERPFDSTLKPGHINYYDIAYMIEAPHIEVVVAELDGELIGSGYARIEDTKKLYLNHRQYAYLGFMYVEEQYRGKGVNKLIIEALKHWAIQQNITELQLEVYDENQSAVKAYEKFGFEKLLVQMRMGIS